MELTLLPTGRNLNIEADETILAAMLRQGAPISYSCKDGRCGLCRCSFSVPDLSSVGETSVDMSSVLACQTVPNADCLVEVPDPDDILTPPSQTAKGYVVAIDSPTNRVIRITIRTSKVLEFSAGQHFEVTWPPDIVRMYSAASHPSDQNLVFHVQIHHNGRASNYFKEVLTIGDTVKIRVPLGSTYLRRNCSAPILCISNNTGLGSLISILNDISNSQIKNPIFVYAGFSMPENVYGEDELKKCTRNIRNLRRCHIVVGGGARRRGVRRGLLTDVLAADFHGLREYRVYAFGSPHAIDVTSRLLRLKGVSRDRLHAEPFHYAAF